MKLTMSAEWRENRMLDDAEGRWVLYIGDYNAEAIHLQWAVRFRGGLIGAGTSDDPKWAAEEAIQAHCKAAQL